MPFQQPRPLGALTSHIDDATERLRSLESRRVSYPGGLALGPTATFAAPNTVLNNPPGWDLNFTVGVTGVVMAFAQVSATTTFGNADILFGVRLDGAPTVILADGIANITGLLPTSGQTLFAGLVPQSVHNLQISLATDLGLSTGTTTMSDPFIVTWSL